MLFSGHCGSLWQGLRECDPPEMETMTNRDQMKKKKKKEKLELREYENSQLKGEEEVSEIKDDREKCSSKAKRTDEERKKNW